MDKQWAQAPAPRYRQVLFAETLDEVVAADHTIRRLDAILLGLAGVGGALRWVPGPAAFASTLGGWGDPVRAVAQSPEQPGLGSRDEGTVGFPLVLGRPHD